MTHLPRNLHGGQLVFTEEVKAALQHGQPVVALESTIITHGMPSPTNLHMATEVSLLLLLPELLLPR